MYLLTVRMHGNGKIPFDLMNSYPQGDLMCINMHNNIHCSEYLRPFALACLAASKIS